MNRPWAAVLDRCVRAGFMAVAILGLSAGRLVAVDVAERLVIMREEIDRAMQGLHMPEYPAAYFISLRLTREKASTQDFREGIWMDGYTQTQHYFVPEVRVGDHGFDQTHGNDDGQGRSVLALNWQQPLSVRHYIWSALDLKYKQACRQYLLKKSRFAAEGIPDYVTDDFTHEKAEHFLPVEKITAHEPAGDVEWVPDVEREKLQRLSKSLGTDARILRSFMRVSVGQRDTLYVNSEGSMGSKVTGWANLYMGLTGLSDTGLDVQISKSYSVPALADMPEESALREDIVSLRSDFFTLLKSSEAQGGLAPALLDPQASAWLFLEFASWLEGERQRDPSGAQVFKAKIGKAILPDFVDIVDDPTVAVFKGRKLLGHYLYDEEAVRAKRVDLVRSGKLVDFLLSRRPVKGRPLKSNGHGRAGVVHDPAARLGNLFVTTRRAHPREELKRMLIEKARSAGRPFGIIIEGFESVDAAAAAGAHQALRARPRMLRFIYLDGHEETYHNSEIVATPLNLMQSILAMGDDVEVQNWIDVGSSGSVPVSISAPSILVAQVEVQKGSSDPVRAPVMPSPLQ